MTLNEFANSWLLGGTTEKAVSAIPAANTCVVQKVLVDPAADNVQIWFNGPEYVFEFAAPPGWPAANEFAPGTLSNILLVHCRSQ